MPCSYVSRIVAVVDRQAVGSAVLDVVQVGDHGEQGLEHLGVHGVLLEAVIAHHMGILFVVGVVEGKDFWAGVIAKLLLAVPQHVLARLKRRVVPEHLGDGADLDLLVTQLIHGEQHVLGIAALEHGVDIHDEVLLDVRALGDLRAAAKILRVEVLAVSAFWVARLGPEAFGVGHAAHPGVGEPGGYALGHGDPALVVVVPHFVVKGGHHLQIGVRIDFSDKLCLVGDGLADDLGPLFVGPAVG